MFIATTQTPNDETSKEQINEDFATLLGRTCEYIKELEDVGRVQKGTYFSLYEELHSKSQSIISENWIK
jgi:hypothetical protein